MRIGIVADDLTGAADSVAPFAERAYRSLVDVRERDTDSVMELSNAFPRGCDNRDQAVSLPTFTRDRPHLKETLRGSIVRRATRRVQRFHADLIYKKIDSTLRGYLRLELDAMLRELPGRLPVLCPAFPANGRLVEDNFLFVHGERQPRTLPEAFEITSEESLDCRHLTLATLRQGDSSVEAAFQDALHAGARALFCDAVTQEDLECLARAILLQPDRYLPVGSAGLSRALAQHLPPPATPRQVAWEETVFTAGRVLIVVGSQNPVSRRQAAYLARKAGITPVIADEAMTQLDLEAFRRAVNPFAGGQRIGLFLSPEHASPVWSVRCLPKFLLRIFEVGQPVPQGLILTGGETAQIALQKIHALSLEIIGEGQPGVVCGQVAESGQGGFWGNSPLSVILKAGGFGTDRTLAQLVGLE
jgi:uncharacterized protein YgbK (DUF1537 family)